MSAFVVAAALDHESIPTVSDVIGPFADAATAYEFVGKHCWPVLLDGNVRWFVVGDESCQYSPQAWIDLQLKECES